MFKIDPSNLSQPCAVVFERDGRTEEFDVCLDICPNPCCRCTEAALVIKRHAAADNPAPPPALAQIRVDVIGRKVLKQNLRSKLLSGGGLNHDMLDSIEAGLTSREWEYFGSLFCALKAGLADKTPLKELKKYVAKQGIDREHLVCYQEIFPFSCEVSVSEGPNRYLPSESYCITPECDCAEVMVQFNGVGPDNAGLQSEPPCIWFDYRRKAFKKEERKPKRHAMALRLGERLRKNHPEWIETLKRRHLRLKEVCN